MEAESYSDEPTARFIHDSFVPLGAHIKENPAYFHRFAAVWTPTVLVLDPGGAERYRIEGYLPREEFRAHLEMGLARISFMSKRWEEAERRYEVVLERHATSSVAPEALYWRGVCRYRATQNHAKLGEVAAELAKRHPESLWTRKASIWAR